MTAPNTTVQWGMLGCGKITNDFVNAMKSSEISVRCACAARSLEAAQAFASTHGFKRAYGSYEELCSDPEIDVVYIGTIHTMHYEHTLLALEHGKNVLVEKPMAMNATQAAHAIAVAKAKKLFLMEGMWTRFFPGIQYVRKLVADGVIGEVHHVNADIGFAQPEKTARLWERKLGGGALLDIGIYPLALATMVLGATPTKTTAVGELSEDGVDVYGAVTMQYRDNKFATVQFTNVAQVANDVTITGTKGRIHIPDNAHHPDRVFVFAKLDNDAEAKEHLSVFPMPKAHPTATHFNFGRSEGMLYESDAVSHAILAKQLERPEYPQSESLAIMQIMDSIRAQLGVVYDQDQ